jgi:hypothetical protein
MRDTSDLYEQLKKAKAQGFLTGLNIDGAKHNINITFPAHFTAVNLINFNKYILNNYDIANYTIKVADTPPALLLTLHIPRLIHRLFHNKLP